MRRSHILPSVALFALLLSACSSAPDVAEAPAETEPVVATQPQVAPEAEQAGAEGSNEAIDEVETAEPEPAATDANARVVAPPPVAVNTDTEKSIYAVGLDISRSLDQLDLSAAEIEIVKRALSDAAAGKPLVDFDEWRPKVSELAQARALRVSQREKQRSAAYLAEAAKAPGAKRSASGMIYRETTAGKGKSPVATDTVTVQYRGTLTNGTEFDSSYSRNAPASFPLNGVIPCWTEGVQNMKVGGKATLTCPSDIAYGDSGRPPTIPGGATLIFDIELLEIAE